MHVLLSTTNLALVINNSVGSWFRNWRELKQGNPLSPLLFILVTDVLTNILKLSWTEKLINNLGPSGMDGFSQCLQFADDTLLFSDVSKSDINSLKLILYCFESSLGLSININDELAITLASMLGCKVLSLPTRYLGIPLHLS